MSAVSQLISDLRLCTSLEWGKTLHKDAVTTSCDINRYVVTALIAMYCKCNNMLLAQQVFDGTVHRDVVIWTSLALGYVENGECLAAMNLLSSMDCHPTFVTFFAALKSCGGLAAENGFEKYFCLEKVISIHKRIKHRQLDKLVNVVNALVRVYSRCGSLSHAKAVFDALGERNTVSWTALILGCVENGEMVTALEFFFCMDCEPDSFTYVAALKALVCETSLEKEFIVEKGVAIHKRAQHGGNDVEPVVATTLLSMYSGCGSMKHAREVFNRMVRRDVVSWTSLITGYRENGHILAAVDVFTNMDCHPSSVTYVSALKACGDLPGSSEEKFALEKGIAIHKQSMKDDLFHSSIILGNTLIDMYSKCRSMKHSCGVFYVMSHRDVVTWNCIIRGHVENGECMAALELFSVMDCKPDSFTYVAVFKALVEMVKNRRGVTDRRFCLKKGIDIHKQMQERDDVVMDGPLENSLLDMYCKCGSIRHAEAVFNVMIYKDLIAWNTLIQGCADSGESSRALELFTVMDCPADSTTFTAALKACGSVAALQTGLQIHVRLCKAGVEQERMISTALMDLYTKCGCMSRAELMFNDLDSPDVISWTVLIAGYCFIGDRGQVFNTREKMVQAGVCMDGVTLMCLLTACNHTGLVEQGTELLKAFGTAYVNVNHFNCVVGMLGRANRLPEALQLIREMPIDADDTTWMTLLGAFKSMGNVGQVVSSHQFLNDFRPVK